jgi:hypothetical protein
MPPPGARLFGATRDVRSSVAATVVELFLPLRIAAARGEVEQVPEWFERTEVTRVLSGFGGCVEQLGTPGVAHAAGVAAGTR